jgi:hypothetical protein
LSLILWGEAHIAKKPLQVPVCSFFGVFPSFDELIWGHYNDPIKDGHDGDYWFYNSFHFLYTACSLSLYKSFQEKS